MFAVLWLWRAFMSHMLLLLPLLLLLQITGAANFPRARRHPLAALVHNLWE
jgi:hypothetical protein